MVQYYFEKQCVVESMFCLTKSVGEKRMAYPGIWHIQNPILYPDSAYLCGCVVISIFNIMFL